MTQNGEDVPTGGGGGPHGHNSYMNEDGTEFDNTDDEMGSRRSSFSGSSPRSSAGSAGGGGGDEGSMTRVSGGSNGSKKVSSSSSSNNPGGDDGVQAIPGVAMRPTGVPFGASALSKTMPNNGRGRPRGLRPRSSTSMGSRTPGSAGSNGQRPSFSATAVNPSSLGRQAGSGSSGSARGGSGGGNALARRGSPSATFREAEARAAEAVAPGVPVDIVVRAAIKIESVMRVLIARGYVRRKLVSEVTAFSLIMERGIEVIKVR